VTEKPEVELSDLSVNILRVISRFHEARGSCSLSKLHDSLEGNYSREDVERELIMLYEKGYACSASWGYVLTPKGARAEDMLIQGD